MTGRLRVALLLYGLTQTLLYAGLLPLWDGFDEPFHYGYVQHLRVHRSLPIFGTTVLSDEVVASLALVPASGPVIRNVGTGVPYREYFAMSPESRWTLRERQEQIDPRTSAGSSQSPDYEAQQAPLAYLVLAPFDAVWANVPLPSRILRLRLLGAITATLLIWWATIRLAGLLGLSETGAAWVLFLVFSTQMFYATVCHVTNDWLAAPLFVWLLAECVSLHRKPALSTALRLGLVLAAGLLTKAYFLALAPCAGGVVVLAWRRGRLSFSGLAAFAVATMIAAPWYLRSFLLSHNFTGMQETARGMPASEFFSSALRLPWLRALLATARGSLWTGNNSLSVFSANTTWILLAALAAAAVCYLLRARQHGIPSAERPILIALLSYAAGLVYFSIVTFWSTLGEAIAPTPWYVAIVWPVVWCLLALALDDSGRTGLALRIAIVWLWTYVIAATYFAKLIPFYAGLTGGTAHLSDLPRWYERLAQGDWGALDTAALLPPGVLLALACSTVAMAVGLAVTLSHNFLLPPAGFRRKLKV